MIPRILHQFWDTGNPPESVLSLLRTWEEYNPGWKYNLWTDVSVIDLIREKYDARVESAYRAGRYPAMRADLGRYIVLSEFGGVYADADLKSLRPIDEVVDLSSELVVFRGMNGVWRNDFLGSAKGNAILADFVRLSVDNIEARLSPENLWLVTGPGMTTPVIEAALRSDLSIQRFEFLQLRNNLFSFNNELDYRSGDLHWSVAQKSESIYVE